MGFLLTSLGFPGPITLFLTLHYLFLTFFVCITLGLLWPILTFPHHLLPMSLLFLSFWASLSSFTSSRPICLLHGPVIHYSCRLGLMVFSIHLPILFCPCCQAPSFYLAFQNDRQQIVKKEKEKKKKKEKRRVKHEVRNVTEKII